MDELKAAQIKHLEQMRLKKHNNLNSG